MIRTQTPEHIAERLKQGDDLLLLDIREPFEWNIAAIDGAERRAMSSINDWWQELPTDREIVIFCHHGVRSAQVCYALETQAGLTNVVSMDGGIERWSLMVDPHVPRY